MVKLDVNSEESERFCGKMVQVSLLMLYSYSALNLRVEDISIHLDHKCHFPGGEHILINSLPFILFIIIQTKT